MARALVVYVHGLWLTGQESLLLRRRLAADFGFEVVPFRYPTVSGSMAEILQSLQRFIDRHKADTLHLVGHSLGGVVIHRFLEREHTAQVLPPGRVVLLGSPLVGSRAASKVLTLPGLSALIGRIASEELGTPAERRWTSARALGVIAGTQPMGLGRLFARFSEPNDGTIAVSETRVAGATDQITLPVSHMGLLLSARAARETGLFLREGRFSLAPDQSRPASARSS
ncbi:MAG TPA: alpha/beta fold hydrolase [Steroidobacteraceae bacterium]|nr:alpha/beta fold hydrolase [Steroidobacteraceae bacterium]